MRRLYREAEKIGIERSKQGGTGEKNIFKKRSLKNAVVRSVENKIRGRKKPGQGEAWAESVLVDEELVMVPAETGAGGPFAETNLVLDERRLFEIPGLVFWKGEMDGAERIELRGIGDVIAERFVEASGVDFHAGFPFLPAAVDRESRFDVGFAEAAILKSD